MEQLETDLVVETQNAAGKTANAQARLSALLKQTQETIASAYKAIDENHGKALSKIAGIEEAKTANIINSTIGVKVAGVGQSAEQIQAIAGKTLVTGRYASEWWDKQADDLKGKFAASMRQGMLRGETNDQLSQRIRGTKDQGYTDGLMMASKGQAAALVRRQTGDGRRERGQDCEPGQEPDDRERHPVGQHPGFPDDPDLPGPRRPPVDAPGLQALFGHDKGIPRTDGPLELPVHPDWRPAIVGRIGRPERQAENARRDREPSRTCSRRNFSRMPEMPAEKRRGGPGQHAGKSSTVR